MEQNREHAELKHSLSELRMRSGHVPRQQPAPPRSAPWDSGDDEEYEA